MTQTIELVQPCARCGEIVRTVTSVAQWPAVQAVHQCPRAVRRVRR
jgi:hypothetical protein